MKIKETRPAEVIVEIICDGCGESCTKDKEKGSHEYGTLAARWGYYSKRDGEKYDFQLCEFCFFKVLAFLKEQRCPLEILKGSVLSFDRPTDPVWPDPNDES